MDEIRKSVEKQINDAREFTKYVSNQSESSICYNIFQCIDTGLSVKAEDAEEDALALYTRQKEKLDRLGF